MAEARHVAHEKSEWRALTTEKDWCQVDEDVIGFDSFAKLGLRHTFSPNVKAGSPHSPVYRQGDMFKVVQADAGAHLDSNTSLGSGYTKITKSSANVIANGKPVAAHNDQCLVNCDAAGVGGAKSKLMTNTKPVFSAVGDETLKAASDKKDGIKKSAKTLWDALFPGKEGDEARNRILEGLKGTLDGLGILGGPGDASVYAMHDWMNGTTEGMEAYSDALESQREAYGAIWDELVKSWGAAEQRSGKVGAATYVLASLGIELAGQKGAGLLTGRAGRVLEIARAAKTPLEAAKLLDAEITAAKAAGATADEIKVLERARARALAQARRNANSGEKGLFVRKSRLPRSATYELNGYKYATDAEGRIVKVEGELRLESAPRNQSAQSSVGKGDGRLPDDHGGHLIGSQFGGYGGTENLTPMAGSVNGSGGKWYSMEQNWAAQLREGKSVKVEIEAIYTDSTTRASSYRVTEIIDGVPNERTILNPKT